MPRVVQPRIPNAGLLQDVLPLTPVTPRVKRLAGRLGEDPATLLPRCAGVLPLPLLDPFMPHKQLVQLIGYRERSAASLRLHIDFDQAATVALRTVSRMSRAVRRARAGFAFLVPDAVFRVPVPGASIETGHSVAFGSACMRIGATVLPSTPLYRLLDPVDLGGSVKLIPLESQRLALTAAESY